MRVHVEGGGGSRVAEPRRYDRDGHAEREHAGGHEVAEIVQAEMGKAGLAARAMKRFVTQFGFHGRCGSAP